MIPPSDLCRDFAASPNPDYVATKIDNVLPFAVAAEPEGQCVRVYFRENQRIVAMLVSAFQAGEIRDALDAALDGRTYDSRKEFRDRGET